MTPEEKNIWDAVFGAGVVCSSAEIAVREADYAIQQLRFLRTLYPTVGHLVPGPHVGKIQLSQPESEGDKEGKDKP